jgi:hypothetical protein
MEDCAPSVFQRVGLWWFRICALGFVFSIDPFWRNMFLKLRGPHLLQSCSCVTRNGLPPRGPHLLQSCSCVTRNGLPPTVREMHLSFENLAIINAPGLQTSLMGIHHDTSLRSILEDDSISLASRAYICSCSARGQGYGWLLNHLSIRLALHTLLSP